MVKVPNGEEKLPKISTCWVGCTNVTDRQTTDGKAIAYSERERKFTFAKKVDFETEVNPTIVLRRHRTCEIMQNKGLLRLNPPTEGFPWDDLRNIFRGCERMAKVLYGEKKLQKISTGWVGCTNVTDKQQTDGTSIAYSEREHEITFAKNVQNSVPKVFIATWIDVLCSNFVKFGLRKWENWWIQRVCIAKGTLKVTWCHWR